VIVASLSILFGLFGVILAMSLGDMIVLTVCLVLLLVVLVGNLHKLYLLQEKFSRVLNILDRHETLRGVGNPEEQVRALIWQSQSLDGLGSDLSDLAKQFRDELQAIRQDGARAIGALGNRLKECTRCSHLAVVGKGEDGSVFQFHDPKGASLPPLQSLLQGLQERAPSLECQTYALDPADSPSFRRWRSVETILFSYHHGADERSEDSEPQSELAVFLGYERGVLPLPREREIVIEVLRMGLRALREHRMVKRVSARARQEQKRQEKYFAHISHDIRTPLNNIQAILDLFFLEGVTESNREFLQVARANCRSLRDIVEELLEFTKYKDGELKVQEEPLDVNEIVKGVVSEFRLFAEVKGVTLGSESEGHQYGISADRKQLKRILMNIVSNGLKYTEVGGVSVRTFERDGSIGIEVKDTGVGIPQEMLKKLFTPFSRIGEVKVEGIGLGLTLTKILVEANNGAIEVYSEHGKGSRFIVSFPAIELPKKEAVEKREFEPSDSEEEDPRDTPEQKILLLDDDEHSGATLARLLRQHAFEVQTLTRVEDLYGLLNFWRPDAIVSDVQMPGGGIEKVLEVVSSFGDIPVFALTGCVDTDKLAEIRNRGVKDIFRKPVDPDELAACLREIPCEESEEVHPSFTESDVAEEARAKSV
jgi:signal transduction histidine kinase/CheY-like chemotaxis protein